MVWNLEDLDSTSACTTECLWIRSKSSSLSNPAFFHLESEELELGVLWVLMQFEAVVSF